MGYPGETVTIDLSTNAPNTTWAVYQIDIIGTNIVDLAIDKGISNAGGTIGVGNDGLWTTTRLVNLDIYHGGCGTGFSQTPLEVDDVVNLKIYGLSVHDTNKCHDDNKHHMLYLAASADTVDIGWIDLHDQGVPGSYPLQYNDDPNPGLTRINNVDFHDSYIRNTARGMVFARGTGMGFRVFNNIFYNTGLDENANYSGIAFKNTFTQALIYNNTFYAQDPLANGAFDFQFATSIVVKNNIIQSSSSSEPYWRDEGIDPSVISASNNLWYGSNQAVPSWDTHPITANPLMVDPTNPARNFHLTSGSPAINAGVSAFVAWDFDEVLRPQGPAPDIGAFEYCASNCSVNDTTPPAKPTGLTVK